MIRYGMGFLVAAGACAAVGLAACGTSVGQGPPAMGTGGASTGGQSGTGGTDGGGGLTGTSEGCVGECCPTDSSCYPLGAKAPGAECFATRDNTGQAHIQMRQDWINATKPIGNTSKTVYSVLAGRSALELPQCNQGKNFLSGVGTGGYIQLIDLYLDPSGDITKDYGTTGFSPLVGDAPYDTAAVTTGSGFCFASGIYYGDPAYRLKPSDMTPTHIDGVGDYPPGLPPPMALNNAQGDAVGWKFGPTRGKRLAEDFDLSDPVRRAAILADLKDDTVNQGVFFYDPTTGKSHQYGPVVFVLVYDLTKTHPLVVPIREGEITSAYNDPKHPNCVGAYRGAALTQDDACKPSDATNPPFGCLNDACPPGQGPAVTHGYFLISELEQVYANDLGTTLCVSYPGADPKTTAATPPPLVKSQGFLTDDGKSCHTAKWSANSPDGIPPGDWCSIDNKPAHDNCHDAWQSVTFHAFSGATIQVPADATQRMTTCPYVTPPPTP